jgi:hypothetical protein
MRCRRGEVRAFGARQRVGMPFWKLARRSWEAHQPTSSRRVAPCGMSSGINTVADRSSGRAREKEQPRLYVQSCGSGNCAL